MQLYLVTVEVVLEDAVETTHVCVVANNADNAAANACIHCQIAPSMARVDVKRIKGNCYGYSQSTKKKQPVLEAKMTDKFPDDPRIRDAERVQASEEHKPRLSKRRIEFRATIYSRTDSSAYVGIGKAIEEYGRVGIWKSEYVDVENIACVEAEEVRPNNPRFEANAQYSVTKVYRG